jgi:hypothetical protein
MRESSPHWGGVKMPAWDIATPSIPNCKLIKTYFHYKIKEIYKDKTDKNIPLKSLRCAGVGTSFALLDWGGCTK